MSSFNPYYTKAQIEEHWVELRTVFEIVRPQYEARSPGIKVHVDESILYLVIASYYHDLSRYQWWHYRTGDVRPENAVLKPAKRTAFMCYWLNKLQPVYVVRSEGASPEVGSDGLPVDLSILSNVHFAVSVAILYLDFCPSEKLLHTLFYHMLWRDESARSYILLFEMLQDARDGNDLFKARTVAMLG